MLYVYLKNTRYKGEYFIKAQSIVLSTLMDQTRIATIVDSDGETITVQKASISRINL